MTRLILLAFMAAALMLAAGCATTEDETAVTSSSAADFDSLWDFQDPAATEAAFAERLPAAREDGNDAYTAELLTQIARAQGLQGEFERAHATLDEADALITEDAPRAYVRSALERGRVLNSSGDREGARPHFERALESASAAGLDFYAIDAAHMLGIVTDGDASIDWNRWAIAMAEGSDDERARGWLGPLYNNLAWTYFDIGKYDEAVPLFQSHLALLTEAGDEFGAGISLWSIAKMHRHMGLVEQALEEQMEILERPERQDNFAEGYTREEIGECLIELGRADEAAPYFARAWELLTKDDWIVREEPERLDRLKKLGRA